MATVTLDSPASVYCHETGVRVTLAAGMVFDDDDPVVKEHAHAFADPSVEDASAAPGKKRTVRKTSAKPVS